MPSRVVRGELVESQSLNRVSIEAELCFVHLVLVADDYGRADGRLDWLRARLFPCRQITFDRLDQWLAELAEEGCLTRYEVEGRPYLALTGWERHRGKGRRAEHSKYPEPPKNPPNRAGDPRKSEETQSNPPEGRGSRVEGIGTRDEGRESAFAPPATEPAAPAPNGAHAPDPEQAGLDGVPQKKARRVGAGKTDPPTGDELDSLVFFTCSWLLDHEAEWPEYHTPEELRAGQPKARAEVERCIDHFRSKGERKADWEATVRNWIRNERKFAVGRATKRAGDEALAHRARIREIEGTAGGRR